MTQLPPHVVSLAIEAAIENSGLDGPVGQHIVEDLVNAALDTVGEQLEESSFCCGLKWKEEGK